MNIEHMKAIIEGTEAAIAWAENERLAEMGWDRSEGGFVSRKMKDGCCVMIYVFDGEEMDVDTKYSITASVYEPSGSCSDGIGENVDTNDLYNGLHKVIASIDEDVWA